MSDQQVIEYIKSALKFGKSKEEVYQELLSKGWKLSDIESAINEASGKPAPKPETPKTVEHHHKEEDDEDTQKKTIRIIVTIGAILIGAGIFSFIAANWQEMSKFVKVAIIVVSMLTAYAGGWFMKEIKDFPKTGEALILLGSIIYGAGIFLVAQMFHIRANWPDGFILWMLGIMLMGFVIESTALLVLSIPVGIVAIVGHPIGIFSFFYYDPFMLTSTFLILITVVATFLAGWKLKKQIPEQFKDYY